MLALAAIYDGGTLGKRDIQPRCWLGQRPSWFPSTALGIENIPTMQRWCLQVVNVKNRCFSGGDLMPVHDWRRRLAARGIALARVLVRSCPPLKRRLLPWARDAVTPWIRWSTPPSHDVDARAYQAWLRRQEDLSAADISAIERQMGSWANSPLISVVMPAYETPERFLRQAIASLQAQLYLNWEICVVDDASPSTTVAAVLAELAATDERIRWLRREQNGHISAASNSALAMATGDWVVLMDHDDLLPRQALYEVAATIAAHPDVQVVFSDEDQVDGEGMQFAPYFKPGFDPDLLMAQNLISHLGAYRRALLQQIGGFRLGLEGSQDHDLALRAVAAAGTAAVSHIPSVLYHWRQAAGRASFSESSLERCIAASRLAVEDYLGASGQLVMVGPAPLLPVFNRIRFVLPEAPPLVSIVMTSDAGEAPLVAATVRALVARTSYPSYEIVIACADSELKALAGLLPDSAEGAIIRLVPVPAAATRTERANLAAANAPGDVLIFLGGISGIGQAEWLEELVTQALRPDVGAVGGKLLTDDGRVAQAGLVLSPTAIAEPRFAGEAADRVGPHGHLAVVRGCSAVSLVCMALRRSLFDAFGGFDVGNLRGGFGDVDLCLRLREAGFRTVWTPYAELRLAPGVMVPSVAHLPREYAVMHQRWGALLAADPCSNPNLSLDGKGHGQSFVPARDRTWQRFLARQAA